ncbi:MAG: hypothetical protein U0174_00515 [Polyangiaceae bacterium]
MRASRHTTKILSLGVAVMVLASCDGVPIDGERRDSRLFPSRGAITGTIRYDGPRPCSRLGHVVGHVVLLVYSRNELPPPTGFTRKPVNFVVVPGDELFSAEPRFTGDSLSCPDQSERVSVSAPFAISPLEGGSYIVKAFYNRSGNFLPSFSIRAQPEAGDIGGGFFDLDAARKNATDPNYQLAYFPVNVGIPQPVPAGAPEGTTPEYKIPNSGFVADSVLVSLAVPVPYTRPYFYVGESTPATAPGTVTPENPSGDAAHVPTLVMTQDHHVLAAPTVPSAASIRALQDSFPSLRLDFGLPDAELAIGTDPREPFVFQLDPTKQQGGFVPFSRGVAIPENPLVPALWPEATFLKLVSDPKHDADPQSLRVASPLVAIRGITLWQGELAKTTDALVPKQPGATVRDLRVLVRPSALCVPRTPNATPSALLVTPHATGKSADASETAEKPLYDEEKLMAASGGLIRQVRRACLPTGRYAMTLSYPTGQGWITPNEAGACATLEGSVVAGAGGALICNKKERRVLPSQGPRAVIEVVPPQTAEGKAFCAGEGAPPRECFP